MQTQGLLAMNTSSEDTILFTYTSILDAKLFISLEDRPSLYIPVSSSPYVFTSDVNTDKTIRVR